MLCSEKAYIILTDVRTPISLTPYREALEYGHRQLGISEELDSPSMRAEAYLNLARAHERLGGLERYVC